ncbi:MAG: HipA domain-containing protein [Pseudomonadota bacterium]
MSIYHIEAWLENSWQVVATLEANTADEAAGYFGGITLNYLLEYALTHLNSRGPAAVSVSRPVTLMPDRREQWPGWLCDLLPQGQGRERLGQYLGFNEFETRQRSSDWPLLAHASGNPIGHLRLREAADWLSQQRKAEQGWPLSALSERHENFLEGLLASGLAPGGTSGAQGEWPKVLMAQDSHDLWHLDHQLPDELAQSRWLVKLARRNDPIYSVILEAEAAYHALARELGLRSYGSVHYYQDTLRVERFDRIRDGAGRWQRIAQESLYSALDCSGFDANLTHLQACRGLAAIVSEPERELLEYVWRDIVNLALGNRDNHGRNTAIQRFEDGRIALSPIYDLAPMLLHPDGIPRRMRWYPDERAKPDWRKVACLLEDEGLLPVGVLSKHYRDWYGQLMTVPERLRVLNCPERVIKAIQPCWQETLNALAEAL